MFGRIASALAAAFSRVLALARVVRGAPCSRRGRDRVCALYLLLHIIYTNVYSHIILSAISIQCGWAF